MIRIFLSHLGESWSIDGEIMKQIEAFTCVMYGYPRETSVDSVRIKMLRKMVGEDDTLSIESKVDLVRLPPCRNSLILHVQRVNHRLGCYKKADTPIFDRPKPDEPGQGWTKNSEGVLEPLWCLGPILPISLVDLLQAEPDIMEEDEDDDINEFMEEEMDDDDEETMI